MVQVALPRSDESVRALCACACVCVGVCVCLCVLCVLCVLQARDQCAPHMFLSLVALHYAFRVRAAVPELEQALKRRRAALRRAMDEKDRNDADL